MSERINLEPRALIQDKTMICRCQINLLLVYKDCIFYAQHLYLLCETYILFQLQGGQRKSAISERNIKLFRSSFIIYKSKLLIGISIKICKFFIQKIKYSSKTQNFCLLRLILFFMRNPLVEEF